MHPTLVGGVHFLWARQVEDLVLLDVVDFQNATRMNARSFSGG